MRLLITGATGFLGNHVMATLGQADSRDLTVIPWDRQKMGDIRNREQRIAVLKEHRPDVVLHLAWSSTKHDNYQEDPDNSSWGVLGADLLHEEPWLCCDELGAVSHARDEGDVLREKGSVPENTTVCPPLLSLTMDFASALSRSPFR